ncbi:MULTISPECIES: hypothetical protein [Xenophilus]|uniref:hypothetical protein n=1 Tax=Xenophilus TaxID=151754 RepID=UPI00056F8642|nr:hypothetical protein [Xenophilus azovorans]
MQPFALTPQMLSPIGGAFYPTGHSMVMYPDETQARAAADALVHAGFTGDAVYFVPARAVLEQISPTVAEADDPLPSAGTDAATVRAFTELARQGHVGLLVRTRSDEDRDRLASVLKDTAPSIAQRYRRLVIEDL